MALPQQKPWAILLCRYSDDNNDPAVTRVMDLAAQWRATAGNDFIVANLNPTWDTDSRTILELYQTFFTITGLFTFNIVRFFDEVSHGLIDVTGNQVFPITIDLTTAQGAALAANPGGAQFQDAMFARAKNILQNQHGVNWKTFTGGVAVSFQSADFGSQGGWFNGGPGAYVDIRYVKNNGTQWWGHEMSHAFGLQHSRTDGEQTSNCTGGAASDYTDPFDIMSIRCARSAVDASYGMRGPGMNAWNMRKLQCLDESRVWKATPSQNFSELLTLHPLHWRNESGYLAAEVPGIAGDSNYLIEFRVPQFWDSAIGPPVVVIHRFDGIHSYIMKSSNNHKGLVAGDYFEKGLGPKIRIQVVSIDAVNQTAVVRVCYSLAPTGHRSVKIKFGGNYLLRTCSPKVPVEGQISTFSFQLTNVFCNLNYWVQWGVQGTIPEPGQSDTASTFSIITPDPSVSVVVFITVVFEDGEAITGYHTFTPLSSAVASWMEFLCNLSNISMLPHPWWEFDPARLRDIAKDFPKKELDLIENRIEKIHNTVREMLRGKK